MDRGRCEPPFWAMAIDERRRQAKEQADSQKDAYGFGQPSLSTSTTGGGSAGSGLGRTGSQKQRSLGSRQRSGDRSRRPATDKEADRRRAKSLQMEALRGLLQYKRAIGMGTRCRPRPSAVPLPSAAGGGSGRVRKSNGCGDDLPLPCSGINRTC